MMESLENSVNKAKETADKANVLMSELRLQFDTLTEIQKEERIETAKIHIAEKEAMRKHYGRIIWGLIITLAIIVGGVIGGMIYLFANYDLQVYTVQDVYASGNGTSIINDGIHTNGN